MVERFAAAVVVAVGLAVAVPAGVATPRAGMGHLALCRVMGRVAVIVVVVVFPARFATLLAWRRFEAAAVLVMLVLPV